MDRIEIEFNKLYNLKKYTALGWFFWDGFLLSDKRERKLYRRLWHSLSKEEKELCENI